VLLPGERQWDFDRHAGCEASVFAGFEIALDSAVEATAGMKADNAVGTLSSGTRISATTGEIVAD
jgi:hypothetical protein